MQVCKEPTGAEVNISTIGPLRQPQQYDSHNDQEACSPQSPTEIERIDFGVTAVCRPEVAVPGVGVYTSTRYVVIRYAMKS